MKWLELEQSICRSERS